MVGCMKLRFVVRCSFHWRRSHGAWCQALTLALRLGLLHCFAVSEVFVLVVRITLFLCFGNDG
jgi:hypothetical protein